MESFDYYEILQVHPKADHEVIAKAYRVLIAKHHPDRGGDEDYAKRLNVAYETLSDPELRTKYDRERAWGSGVTGHGTAQQPGAQQAGAQSRRPTPPRTPPQTPPQTPPSAGSAPSPAGPPGPPSPLGVVTYSWSDRLWVVEGSPKTEVCPDGSLRPVIYDRRGRRFERHSRYWERVDYRDGRRWVWMSGMWSLDKPHGAAEWVDKLGSAVVGATISMAIEYGASLLEKLRTKRGRQGF